MCAVTDDDMCLCVGLGPGQPGIAPGAGAGVGVQQPQMVSVGGGGGPAPGLPLQRVPFAGLPATAPAAGRPIQPVRNPPVSMSAVTRVDIRQRDRAGATGFNVGNVTMRGSK